MNEPPCRALVRPPVSRPRPVLPAHAPGLRIGLFGGSFNPPHEAHRAISLLAMKKLRLDRLWWLVTPGNPLKDTRELPSIEERVAAAQALADHPRIDVTGFEAVIGARYSSDTIAWLLKECPGIRFVWIMGADNLKSFHRWRNWRQIFMTLPIAVMDRGNSSLSATSGAAAHAFSRARLAERDAASLATRIPPAWVYLHGVKSNVSSTALREAKKAGA